MIYLVIPILLFLVLAAGAFLAFKAGAAHSNQDLSEARKGCLSTLINGLLRPIPVIFAFYQFGLPVAVIVAIVLWAINRVLQLYKGQLWSEGHYGLLVLPLCAGLTLFTQNALYFQLIPSGLCALIALDQLLGIAFRRPRLSSIDLQEMPFSDEEIKLVRWSILAASLLCLLISEYARLNLSLTEWLWYYGYFRIELIVLFIVSLIPAMIKMNKRSENE